jgi:8-oxo-dGTP pyrophosphatase MutT (NUDIX family)
VNKCRVSVQDGGVVDRSYIRVKAMAYLPNAAGTHHAVLRGSDPSDGRTFHRLLGGGVELGERSVEAVVREIAEELGATMLEPRLLGVL